MWLNPNLASVKFVEDCTQEVNVSDVINHLDVGKCTTNDQAIVLDEDYHSQLMNQVRNVEENSLDGNADFDDSGLSSDSDVEEQLLAIRSSRRRVKMPSRFADYL